MTKNDVKSVRAGFVGLGDMGGAQAQRIIDAGFPTTLWARREVSLEPYKGASVHFAKRLRELGERCDIVGVCVFGDDDVIEVVDGEGEGLLHGMAAGSVIAIHSTVSQETCERLQEVAAKRGVGLLDAPVSGARLGAEEGRLCVMVGGDPKNFEKAKPVFESFGKVIELMGPLGSGQCAKVINNVLTFVNVQTAHLALTTGEKLGVDVEKLKTVLAASGGNSFGLYALTELLLPHPEFCGHSKTMVEKDTRIFQKICASKGVARTHLDTLAEENCRLVDALSKR